jgi:hypothetical protein
MKPMKLTFFLIAIAFILLRLCYPSLELWHSRREQGTMISRGDNYIQGIWWSGKYRLSDDDRTIAELSPGGYLKFRENDTSMKAESNLEGKISYTLYNGRENLPMNDSGRNFLAAQLQKMIRLGFFADERAQRIYQQGGVSALLAELSRIKMEGDRGPYLNRVLRSDSLTASGRIALLRLTGLSGDMVGRQHILQQFGRDQLHDSAVAHEWLSAVGRIDASYMKKDLLLKNIDSGLTADVFDSVVSITSGFGSDVDQQEVYKALIQVRGLRRHDPAFAQSWLRAVGQLGPSYMKKDLFLLYLRPDASDGSPIPVDQFGIILEITGHFGSSIDEQQIYLRMADLADKTDTEWAGLIQAAGTLDADYLKSELLIRIAPKMPPTDSLRSTYRMAAKSIQGDMDYGKTMRALEGR